MHSDKDTSLENSTVTSSVQSPVNIRLLGRIEYQQAWDNMREFNTSRDEFTRDEIWIVEHPSVFTLGLNGQKQHVLDAGDIPVIKCDRGGQVTYHGPGQLVAYVLMDLERRHWGVKKLVTELEQAVINLLKEYAITGERKDNAPGVYVNGAKIAALGLRIRRGCSYHGLSLNVDMDLSPFERINPCGYRGLESTQLRLLTDNVDLKQITDQLIRQLKQQLYDGIPA